MKPLITLCVLFFIAFTADCQSVLWQDYVVNENSYYFASQPTAITTDHMGNVIVSGIFEDSVAFLPYTLKKGSFYLVKYNSNGKVQWAVGNTIGNASTNSVATDSYGNIYLTGQFSDTLKIGSAMVAVPLNYVQSFFLAKFDPNGNIQWIRCSSSNYYGGSSGGWSVVVDHSDNVYVTGTFSDTVRVGGFVAGCSYWYTGIFIAKYSPGGNPLWLSAARAGSASGYGASLNSGVDSTNNIYVSGEFGDTIYCGTYSIPASTGSLGGSNIFLLKFDSSGNNKWAKAPGVMQTYGSAVNYSSASYMSMCSDSRAYLYITSGYVGSYKYGSYVFPVSNNNAGLAFLVKLRLDGSVVWAECDKAGNGSCGMSLSSDGWGNIYLGGWAEGRDTLGGISLGQGGFVAKFDSNGHGLCQANINSVGWYSFNGISANQFLPLVNIASIDEYGSDGFKVDSVNTNGGGYVAEWTCNSCRISSKITGTTKICDGQTVKLSDSAGGVYLWSTGSNDSTITVSPSTTTVYSVYYINGSCYGDTSITVTVFPVPTPTITAKQNICIGDSAIITASGGTMYFWNNGDSTATINVKPTTTTTYTVSVSNGDCVTKDSSKVIVFTMPVAVVSDTQSICTGSAATLTASGGLTYQWNNGETTSSVSVSPAATTTYDVIIYNGPCKANDSINVIVHAIPMVNISPTQKLCSGNADTITASGGGQYLWSNGDTTATIAVKPSTTTSYKVTVSNTYCSISDSTMVLVYSHPKPVIAANRNICQGRIDTIAITGGASYLWSTGQADSVIQVKPTINTTYTVVVYNGPCLATDSVNITVNALPIVTACCDTAIMEGKYVSLTSSGGGIYSWSPSAGLSCDNCPNPTASPISTTTYTLTITSDSGCTATTTVTIDVTCGTVFVPEAFSPGNSGHNNILYVRGDCINTLTFMVFDRWGNKVFETNDKNIGWDGSYKGSPMNTGSYSYLLTATEYDGTTITRHGDVTLVR